MPGNPVLAELARAYDKSVARVVLRWLIQRDVVIIPKSSRPQRMAENLDISDVSLTDEDMARIATLDAGASSAVDHRDPANVAFLGAVRFDT